MHAPLTDIVRGPRKQDFLATNKRPVERHHHKETTNRAGFTPLLWVRAHKPIFNSLAHFYRLSQSVRNLVCFQRGV